MRRLGLVLLLLAATGSFPVLVPEAAAQGRSYEWRTSLSATGRFTAVATSIDGSIALAGRDFPLDSPEKIRITRDGGGTWASLANSPTALWSDVAMDDDGSVMALTGEASGQSTLWLSHDGGTSFSVALAQGGTSYGRLALSADGARVLVLSSAGVLLSTNGGMTFGPVAGLGSVTTGDVAMTSDGTTMYAAHNAGGLHRSTDGGGTWAAVAGAGSQNWSSFDVSGDGQTLLGVVSYQQPGVAALVSNDGGATFFEAPGVGATFNNQLAQGGLSRDGRVMVATTYGTSPMVSADGGQTWVESGGGARGWLRFALSGDGSSLYGAVESQGVVQRALVPPPVISGLSPSSLQSVGGQTLTVTGTHFVGVTTVTVAGQSRPFTVVSSAQLRVTTSAMAVQTAEVVVTTTNGSTSGTVPVQFPEITGVSPAAGPASGGVTGGDPTTSVSGNFFGLTVLAATVGASSAPIVSASTSTVVLTVPPGTAGVADVILETSHGELRRSQAFTRYVVASPRIDGTSPSSVSWAGGASITLSGPGLGDAASVTVGAHAAPIVGRNSPNSVTVLAPAGPVGLHDVTVHNVAGMATSTRAVLYTWEYVGEPLDWDGFGGVAGNGAINSGVLAITTLTNGDLILGGSFSNVAGLPAADNVVRWDGTNWSALGSNGAGGGGLNGALNGAVHDLAVEADGSIVAVGDFVLADGSMGVARFTGGAWVSVSAGLGNSARAVQVAPTGDLYVGGHFVNVGGDTAADYVVRWDRASGTWRSLGSNGAGNGALTSQVRSLAVIGDGLVVGGHFQNAAGIAQADGVAFWNGTTWSALGSNGASDGSVPSNHVVTTLATRVIDGVDTILVGTCRNGSGDGAAFVVAGGQWDAITGIALNDCVRDGLLLADGRAVLAGWFTDTLVDGATRGLAVGADGLGWAALGAEVARLDAVHLDPVRSRLVVGTATGDMGGDATADFTAVADATTLLSTGLSVVDPGTIEARAEGGTAVTLAGSDFGPSTGVTVGDLPVSMVTVSSSTSLTFVVPAGLGPSSTLTVYDGERLLTFPGAVTVGRASTLPVGMPTLIAAPVTTTGSPTTTAPTTTAPPTTTPSIPTTTVAPDGPPPAVVAPSSAQIALTPTEDWEIFPPTVISGQTFEVALGGFTPGEWVYAYVASEPTLVGAARADATGTVRLSLEIPALSGQHSLVLYEPSSGLMKRQALDIVVPALPRTGGHPAGWPIGLALTMFGVLLLVASARIPWRVTRAASSPER